MSCLSLFKLISYCFIAICLFSTSVCTPCCPPHSVCCLFHLVRYYMIAEYADRGEHISAFLHEVRLERATTDDREFEEGGTEKQSPSDQEDRVDVDGIAVAVSTDGRKDSLSAMDQGKNGMGSVEKLCLSLPPMISCRYPITARKIEDFILSRSDISLKDHDILKVPISALSAWWAPKRLSIVGKHCRRSYCFTHSYGRLYDMSSGSLYFEVSDTCGIIAASFILCVDASRYHHFT